jgi:hypothetical protein
MSSSIKIYFDGGSRDSKLKILLLHGINWFGIDKLLDLIDEDSFLFFTFCCSVNQNGAKKLKRAMDVVRAKTANLIVMPSTKDEYDLLIKQGLNARIVLVNYACFTDFDFFRPIEVTKLYDYIMIATMAKCKRIHLAEGLSNICFITKGTKISRNVPNYDVNRLDMAFTNHNREVLSPEEVRTKINQSRVGLIFSAAEGVCFASSECLACGIPVISTKSIGGRDFFYNEGNSVIVEPSGESVQMAAERMTGSLESGLLSSEQIRNTFIEQCEQERSVFIGEIQRIFDLYQIEMPASEFFKDNFSHKLIKSINWTNIATATATTSVA